MSVDTVDELFARFGRAYVPMVMATGMVASFVMVVSSTIVNVAVPDVMGAFGIGQDQAQLMATAFNVSMTASQLLNAWVVAVLGQRYGFAAALIIYTCGSVIGGFSPDFNMIVLGRVLQGIASGIIQPLILVTIFQVFPQERRGFAAGVYSMALMLAVAMGPVFGGLAMEVLDWRYIFIAPLPVIGIAFVAGMFVLPSNRQESNRPFDWTGYGLMVVTLFCFMTGLTDSSDIVRGLESGGVDYLTKPIRQDELLARMRVHLTNARITHSAKQALDSSGQFLFSANSEGDINWATPQAFDYINDRAPNKEWKKTEFKEAITYWL